MASERVKPDVRRWIDGSALYDRSTILRVIDERIAELDAMIDACSRKLQHDSAAQLNASAQELERLRARFEEADDDS